MSGKKIDSIECSCGARLALARLGDGVFTMGSYKDGMTKSPVNHEHCVWCGLEFPENIRQLLKMKPN